MFFRFLLSFLVSALLFNTRKIFKQMQETHLREAQAVVAKLGGLRTDEKLVRNAHENADIFVEYARVDTRHQLDASLFEIQVIFESRLNVCQADMREAMTRLQEITHAARKKRFTQEEEENCGFDTDVVRQFLFEVVDVIQSELLLVLASQ